MIAKANVKIGGVAYQFEFDEKEEINTLHKIIVLTNPKKKCNECGDFGLDSKHLVTNKDKDGNTYINLKCKCGARSKLGQYKSGGYFWHDYELYIKKEDK